VKLPIGADEDTEGGVGVTKVAEVTLDPVAVGELGAALFLYISNREPAPQYSYGFPGQMKLQSVRGAGTDPACRVLPQ
jgi:hypothetical protein